MDDFIRFDMQSQAVERLMREFPDELERRLLPEGKRTAERVAREAQNRLDRALGPDATGKTAAGIQVEESRDGRGYVVVARRSGERLLPRWLDKGTRHMDARLFFDDAGRLEEGPYLRRVTTIIGDLIAEKGLGE